MCAIRSLICLALAARAVQVFALEPDQVYAKVAPSIVVVFGYNSSAPNEIFYGSGVIVAPGQIVTNCHVVEGADVIYLRRGGIKTLGILRYSDPDRDLCQIGATDLTGFTRVVPHIESTDKLRVGQKVYAIGAPQGFELTLSNGLIASLRNLPIGTIIQTNAPVSQGSSGGGLFDSNGQLIGITSFVFREGQNLNFAVPASWISELATRHKAREEEEVQKTIGAEESAEQRRREEAEQEFAEQEKQRQEDEAFMAERRKRMEDETFRNEERKRMEEQHSIDEAKRDEERKQRAEAVDIEQLRQDADRKQREADEAKRKADAAARPAQQKLIDDWRARIQLKIKSRVVVPPNIQGNPEVRVELVLLPGGEILSANLMQSSGNVAYDAAVRHAIAAAQPLPVPSDGDLFHENFRYLTLVFRPKD